LTATLPSTNGTPRIEFLIGDTADRVLVGLFLGLLLLRSFFVLFFSGSRGEGCEIDLFAPICEYAGTTGTISNTAAIATMISRIG
jgi:hypothetical protein